MRISQLPEDIKAIALHYQKIENYPNYCKKTDNLERAFHWEYTEEGDTFWSKWDNKKKIIKPLKDSIVESVRKQLLDRSNVGINKYGVTLDRTDLSLLDWLEHAKQESMDQVLYLEKAIQQLKRQNENIDSKSSILFGQPNLKIEFPHRQS